MLCQEDETVDYTAQLCADKRNEELFRLQTGKSNCRDVVQCTDSVGAIFAQHKPSFSGFAGNSVSARSCL